MSSDEESGSSTSSCEESAVLQNNASAPSASNSPVPRRNNSDAAKQSGSTTTSTDTTTNASAVKKEEMKSEVKSEVKTEAMDTSSSGNNPVVPSSVPKKEEEYDSSATMSADERESEPRATTIYMQQQQQQPYLPPGMPRPEVASIRPLYPPGVVPPPNVSRPGSIERPSMTRPQMSHCGTGTVMRPMAAPMVPAGAAGPNNPQQAAVVLPDGVSKDTITVKELMINVIEKSLSHSHPIQNAQVQSGVTGHSNQPPPSPTIQNLLDGSSKPPNKTNFVRERIGLNPRVGSMAPPAAPPPQQQQQPPQQQQQQPQQQQQQQQSPQTQATSSQQQQQSNECETLDLSMPRRRESAATPPAFQRDPLPHRKSPSFSNSMASATAAEQARPPPAHVNKVKTEPFLRDISPSSFDGRPLTTPPHASHTSPSPGPPRPPSSSSRGVIPTTQAYMGRNPLPQPSVAGRQPALSPKVTSKPPLTIQTGSITQGTPVQQGAQQRYGEPLLKMTPPDVRAAGGGSITQGTPVYDKTARRIQESAYFAQAQGAAGRNAAAALAAANAAAAGFPDQHLTSRQVIMNDYAMARSNEMQRRPDSRDAHGRSVSPSARGSLRDLSPRPRTLDPRTAAAAAAQLSRDGRPTSSDPRLDPRYIAAVAASEQQHRSISGLPEPRGDPKADIPALHKDPRGLQRAQPASTLSRSYFIGPSTTVSAPSSQLSSQQVCTISMDLG